MGAGWDRGTRAAFAAGLWRRDPTLWSADAAHHAVAARRLGWLGLPAAMRGELAGLTDFTAGVRAEGFTHAVLLGMGGSSLAPEVMRRMLGVCPGFLELTVLDNTSPAAVRAVAAAHDPARTLFVVSSKSGGTIEVASFERYFFAWAQAARGDVAGAAFVAVTDAGSPLEKLARERGYRQVFLNPPDVGGRYSALSLFGLVPAALIGADLEALLASAAHELDESRRDAAGGEGVAFGAAMGAAALDGADKLTLAFGPAWAPFGAWVEQLVAESTGKEGRGILPVDGEPFGPAALARADRGFAVTPDLERSLGQAIAHSDRPAWLVDLPAPAGLGAAFLRWEIATAAAAAVLGVDPFDEPDVAEAKRATAAVLERALAEGRFPEDGPRLSPVEAAAALRERLRAAGPTDYLAVLAYLHATPAVQERLERLRTAAAGDSGLATTLGYGPRFLHSTGQLHKGGPAGGIYLQLTAAEEPDLGIPGERYTFGTLRRAQAAGDLETLARRGRRVLRLDLGDDPAAALDALVAGLERG